MKLYLLTFYATMGFKVIIKPIYDVDVDQKIFIEFSRG